MFVKGMQKWKRVSPRIQNFIFSSLQTQFLEILTPSVTTVHHHETSFKEVNKKTGQMSGWSICDHNHVISAVNTKIEIKFEVWSDAAGEQAFALFYTHLKTYYTHRHVCNTLVKLRALSCTDDLCGLPL